METSQSRERVRKAGISGVAEKSGFGEGESLAVLNFLHPDILTINNIVTGGLK